MGTHILASYRYHNLNQNPEQAWYSFEGKKARITVFLSFECLIPKVLVGSQLTFMFEYALAHC